MERVRFISRGCSTLYQEDALGLSRTTLLPHPAAPASDLAPGKSQAFSYNTLRARSVAACGSPTFWDRFLKLVDRSLSASNCKREGGPNSRLYRSFEKAWERWYTQC